MFKVNHSEVQGNSFDPIPEGTYEAIVSNVDKRSQAGNNTYSSGAQGLALTLTIRDDVDQEARKRKLFENLVISDKAMFKFQQYAKATALPDGTNFNTEDELMNGFGEWLPGKAVRVSIKHTTYNDKVREQVVAVDASKLEAGAVLPESSNPFASSGVASTISDEELPF